MSLDEFLELREFLEVPAARLAARRHTPEALERLQAAIPGDTRDLGTEEQFIYNKDFHSQVVLASGNTLLSIAAQPIFSVLQTNLSRSHARPALPRPDQRTTTARSRRRSPPATRTPPPRRCTATWRTCAPSTRRPGAR